MKPYVNKHIIRYLKDIKQLHILKRGFNKCNRLKIFPQSSYKGLEYIDNDDIRYKIYRYVLNENSKDIKKLFNAFLKYHKIIEPFYKNIDKQFVLRFSYANKIFTGEEIKNTKAFDLIQYFSEASEYINYAFSQDYTNISRSVWCDLDSEWRKLISIIFNALISKETFDEPLFKTDEEYEDFIRQNDERL